MKNILIIGATSGIGREMALQYAARGNKVAATGRRAELLAGLKAEYPDNIFTYTNDVREGRAEQIVKTAAADLGGLDAVIICAGVGHINQNLNAAPELDTVMTNVYGFTDFADAAYNYLDAQFKETARKGRLAAISSIASFRGSDDGPAYYASKAYVSNYLEGLRKKAFKTKSGVSVTTIIPGFVDTALAKSVGGVGLFWMAPVKKAAEQIITAVEKDKSRAYITKRWALLAFVMRNAPDFLYNRIY